MKHNLITICVVTMGCLLNLSNTSASALSPMPVILETVAEGESPYNFTLATSEQPHKGEPFCIHLRNRTGGAVEDLRILFISKIDESQPFTPGNTSHSVWQFVPSDLYVPLPLFHKHVCLVVYQGNFNEDALPALDVIRRGAARALFMFDGETVDANVRSVDLLLNKS